MTRAIGFGDIRGDAAAVLPGRPPVARRLQQGDASGYHGFAFPSSSDRGPTATVRVTAGKELTSQHPAEATISPATAVGLSRSPSRSHASTAAVPGTR